MKKTFGSMLRLVVGLYFFSLAILFMVKADIGVGPWDVFHLGLSSRLHLSFGIASIYTGLFILILDALLGEKIGWGSIVNMWLIGAFYDLNDNLNIIRTPDSWLAGFLMLNLGLALLGCASTLYMSAGLGKGPRDGLMVALMKRTGKSVAFIRNCIEGGALLAGIAMGGKVGLGTIFIVFATGYYMQFAYRIFRFDVKSVHHRTLDDDFVWLKAVLAGKRLQK